MAIRLAAFLFLAVLLPVPGQAAPSSNILKIRLAYTTVHGGLRTAAPQAGAAMPKLGLALSGGGARAAASIGVLKVLDKEGIPIAAIAGTSMGAGVGGLYAAGRRPDEIEEIFLGNDWNDIFSDTPRRSFQTQEQKDAGSRHLLEFTFYRGRFMPPSGLSAGQKLTNLLAAKTLAASLEADFDFDRLRTPFRAIATDIETGEAVVLRGGLLHEALRASAAIPLVFQPVELQGRLLVDGGLVRNLPVDAVKAMDVDAVLAVDASAQLEKKERMTSLLEIMGQSISLQVRRESERQAALADLVLIPDTSAYSFADFPSMREIIRKGEEAAQTALPRIRELMRPRSAARTGADRFRLTTLTIRGAVNSSEDEIRRTLAPILLPSGATADELLAALADLYRLGWFSDVALDLEKMGEWWGALLTIRENPVVKNITVSGNTLVPTSVLLARLSWQKNEALNVTRLTTELDRLVADCRARGYLLTRVERTSLNEETGELELVLYEGRVDSISLIGQRKTKRSMIRRETATRPGSPLNFELAARDIQHLYALDYFESLSADMTKSPRGGIDLALKIKEKPTTKVRLGLRYDLEDRFTGLTDLVEDNVTGRGIKAFLNTRYGNYTDLTLGYHSPIFLDTSFVHTVQTFFRKRAYPLYENKRVINETELTRTGAEFAFGYQWFRFGDTYLRYRYAVDRAETAFGAAPARDFAHIGSLAILTTVDTQDRHTFPHSGLLLNGSHEIAQPGYGGDQGFTKTSVVAQGAVPLAERHTALFDAALGLGNGDLPYQEKFGIGGADALLGVPLAGYQRREFTGNNALGFSAAYRWKLKEYKLKAVKAVYVNLAGQAADVRDSRKEVSVDHLRTGGGFGLHADTVLGPVRLDFGMAGQGRRTIAFSAGYDF